MRENLKSVDVVTKNAIHSEIREQIIREIRKTLKH